MCINIVLKFNFYLINFLIALLGAAICAIGALVSNYFVKNLLNKVVDFEYLKGTPTQETLTTISNMASKFSATIGQVIIAVGVIILIFSAIGLIAVCCKSGPLIKIYSGILILLGATIIVYTFIVLYSPASVKYIYMISMSKFVTTQVYIENKLDVDKMRAGTQLWFFIERNLNCCGVKNYTDMSTTVDFDNQPYVVLSSCCKDIKDKECWKKPTKLNSYIETPCQEALWRETKTYINRMNAVLLGIGICIVLFGMFSAILVCMKRPFTWI